MTWISVMMKKKMREIKLDLMKAIKVELDLKNATNIATNKTEFENSKYNMELTYCGVELPNEYFDD